MRARWLVTIAAMICARTAATEPRGDGVLASVPADALAILGIDLVATRASPALAASVTRLVHATGLDDPANGLGKAGSLVIAGVPGLRRTTVIPRVRAGQAVVAFGMIWLEATTRRRLAQILPDLGAIAWLAGTLEQSPSGFTLAGSAAFADPYVAARIAVSIGMGRKLVTSQLPAAVAIAVDKLAVTAMGAQIRISATWSEADLAALASL